MSGSMKAAVVRAFHEPLRIEEVPIRHSGPVKCGEVVATLTVTLITMPPTAIGRRSPHFPSSRATKGRASLPASEQASAG